jgi:hypothetical protein
MNGPVAYGACLNQQIASLQSSPGIPSLSGYDRETRQAMELACISDKTNGPAAYGACLNRQIASLQSSPGIPSLSGYDRETRQAMELACISDKTNGPAAYGACLNRQIASLQSSPGIPSLSGYDRETRQAMELACISDKTNGPVAYGACLNRQIASLRSSPGTPNLSGNASLQSSPSTPNPSGYDNETPRTTSGGTAVHSANGSGTDVPPQVKDGWLQVSEDLSFRPDSIKLGDKEISVLMQLKTPDDQLHLSIVGVPYKVCSQGYGKIRFYDLSHVFQADADAALNGNSHGSYVATMLCAVKSEATKPK